MLLISYATMLIGIGHSLSKCYTVAMGKRSSEHKKKKYSTHFERSKINRIRKIIRHLKKQPNDVQSKKALDNK